MILKFRNWSNNSLIVTDFLLTQMIETSGRWLSSKFVRMYSTNYPSSRDHSTVVISSPRNFIFLKHLETYKFSLLLFSRVNNILMFVAHICEAKSHWISI
jgi:hypothetical protein